MFDIKLAAGERIFALQSAYTSPQGSCPFFNPDVSNSCMFQSYMDTKEKQNSACEGIHYQNGLLCLRITQFLMAIEVYIPGGTASS